MNHCTVTNRLSNICATDYMEMSSFMIIPWSSYNSSVDGNWSIRTGWSWINIGVYSRLTVTLLLLIVNVIGCWLCLVVLTFGITMTFVSNCCSLSKRISSSVTSTRRYWWQQQHSKSLEHCCWLILCSKTLSSKATTVSNKAMGWACKYCTAK